MKSKLLLLALAITMASCGGNVDTKSTTYTIPTLIGADLQVVEIEECEYFFTQYDRSAVFTHKGNCKNPIHQHNGGQHE
jgi:hypothetical protein